MLLRQTLLYLPAQVLGPLFQFVAVVLWTHWLAPKDLGVFALISATQELCFVVGLGWYSLFTIRYGAQLGDPGWRRRYLDTEACLLLLASAAALPISVALLLYIEQGRPSLPLLLATIAYSVTRTVTLHLLDRTRASMQIMAYSVLQVAGPVLGLLLGLAAVHWIEASPAAVLAGYGIAHALGLVAVLPVIGYGRALGRAHRDIVSAALAYGWPFMLGTPAIWLCFNGIRYIVDYAEGAVAVGLITVGWGLGQRTAGFAALTVAAAGFPLAVKRTHDQGIAAGVEQLNRNGVLLFLVMAPAMGGLVALADPFVRLLVAAPYQAMTIAILPWAALAGAVRAIRLHFSNPVFLLHEETHIAMQVDLIDAAVTVALTVVGLWLGGVLGAVIGASLATLVALAASHAWSWRRYGFRAPVADYARIALATLAMMLALRFFGGGATPLGVLTTGVLVGTASYVIMLLLILPAAQQELRTLLALVRNRAG